MKKLAAVALTLSLALTGCGGGSVGPAVASTSNSSAAAGVPIQSGAYKESSLLFGGEPVVESTYWPTASGTDVFFGCANNQTCIAQDLQPTSTEANAPLVIPQTCRFNYVFAYSGVTYLVCNDSQPSDGDIYLYASTDLTHWTIQNGGNPIVTRQPGTNWAHVWNVAIQPVGSRWYMLAETSSTLNGMGLSIAWADPANSMDFTPNEGPTVIQNAGNPQLLYSSGELIALHGMYPMVNGKPGNWYVTESTASPSNLTNWTTRPDKLLVQEPGVDVADPTYVQANGVGYLAVSYAQKEVLQLSGPALLP